MTDGCDIGPPFGKDVHQTTGLELLEGLSHGGSGNLKPFGYFVNVQLFSRPQTPLDDVVLELFSHSLYERRFGVREGHG